MKKLILMTILFLTLQSSGYINFKGAHFRKLEEGEHYYYILSISPLNTQWDSMKYIPKNSLRHRNIWSCTTNIYWYTPTSFQILFII